MYQCSLLTLCVRNLCTVENPRFLNPQRVRHHAKKKSFPQPKNPKISYQIWASSSGVCCLCVTKCAFVFKTGKKNPRGSYSKYLEGMIWFANVPWISNCTLKTVWTVYLELSLNTYTWNTHETSWWLLRSDYWNRAMSVLYNKSKEE